LGKQTSPLLIFVLISSGYGFCETVIDPLFSQEKNNKNELSSVKTVKKYLRRMVPISCAKGFSFNVISLKWYE
jgi:hypothetical protein